MVKFKDISKVFQYKSKDTATLLGSGKSINNILDEEWSCIKKNSDIWAMNNWIYHPYIVPNFYHLEIKSYDFPIIEEHMNKKREIYKDVKFIVPKREVKRVREDGTKYRIAIEESLGNHSFIFKYSKVRIRGKPRQCGDANYKIENMITKSYCASISVIMELLYKFEYKKIYLYGIDMNNSLYFWTGGDPIYGKVHHQTNKSHEDKDPNLPHSASHMKSFLVDFNKRWMKPFGRNIYVGHKDTLLWPEIEYKRIL